MAKEHYNAVRESDLYEYGGTRKVLLTYIAGLIIGPPKENARGKPIGEPDKDEGWCVARQEVLAAWVGCSPGEACRQIDQFVTDGWLTKEKYTDTYGHERCKYAITPAQMKKIQARKMKIEEKNGGKHPIRAKHPGKRGNDKSRLNLVRPESGKRSHHKKLNAPLDDSSKSPLITHQDATCGVVNKPVDDSSIPVVGSVLPSLGKESSLSGKTPEKTQTLIASLQGKKEKTTPTPGPQGNISPAARKPDDRVPPAPPDRFAALNTQKEDCSICGAKKGDPERCIHQVYSNRKPRPAPPVVQHLEPKVADKMKKLGFPEPVIGTITKMRDWSKALNNTTNVLSSYETLAMKPNGFASKMFEMWMPKRILSGGDDGCYDQGYEESVKAENALPKEQRIEKAAIEWFCNFAFFDNEEKMHTIIDFPRGYMKHLEAIKIEANRAKIATAYLADLQDRRRSEYEHVMKLEREAIARRAEIAENAAQFGKPKTMDAIAAGIPDEGSAVDDI